MPRERIVITALGMVSPWGVGPEAFWARLLEKVAFEGEVPRLTPGVPAPAVGYLFHPEFEAERYAEARTLRKVSSLTRLATVATGLCLEQAKFPEDPLLRGQTGVHLGTCFGSSAYHLEYHEALRRSGPGSASALLFTQSVLNAATGHISKVHRLRGTSHTLVGGETVGLDAIGHAVDRVRLGVDRAALAGGADQYDDRVHTSVNRMGLVGAGRGALHFEVGPITEGACLVLIEKEGDRGRTLPATEVLGIGRAHPGRGTSPAVASAMARACEEAGLDLAEVDLVVSGAAGGAGAVRELEVIASLFREAGAKPFLAAPKGWMGEGFAFTSAALVLVAALALERGVVPPTLVGEPPPTLAPLRAVVTAEASELAHAVVVATTASGKASAMVLGRIPPGGS